jgi:transposase
MVSEGHPVRIVNSIIDKVDIQSILDTYRGGGSSGYHPRMLLKVLVYAYLKNIYSSRQIEEALKENIHFMWLSGMSKPDHNTINRFRGKRLDGNLKEIFGSVVQMLSNQGYLSIKEVYIDGTKVEANANRYTFVWGKAIATQKQKIKEQLEQIWAHVQSVYENEKDLPPTPDFEEISAEKVEKAIAQINEALKDKEASAEVKKN